MDSKAFIQNFAEALELDAISSISEDTEFRTIPEWDSLSYLSVIAMMDEEYGIQIESREFKNLKTVRDIINFISDK